MEIRRILVTIVEIIALTALPSTAGADALVLIRLEGLFFTDPGAPPDPTMLASESFAFSVTISEPATALLLLVGLLALLAWTSPQGTARPEPGRARRRRPRFTR